MRKITLVALTAILALPLVSCGESSGNNEIENALASLRKGVKVGGTLDLLASYYDQNPANGGTLNGETDNQTYYIDYVYENDETVGIQRRISTEDEDGTMVDEVNETYVQGDDGYLYFLELDYKNQAREIEAVDDAGNPINYASYFDNPFSYLTSSDFVRADDGSYSLNRNKAYYLVSQMFGQTDEIFYNVIKSASVTIADGQITGLKIIPEELDTYDTVNYTNVYYRVSAEANITLSLPGTAQIAKPQPKAHQTSHDALQRALNVFDNQNNYTQRIAIDIVDSGVDQPQIVYNFYYTESAIFWQIGDGTEPVASDDVLLRIGDNDTVTAYGYDVATSTWTAEAGSANGFSGMNGADKDLFIPVIGDVAAEVFNYDASKEEYDVVDELETYIGAECFLPVVAVLYDLNGYGEGCTITLEGEENHETIKLINLTTDWNDRFNDRQLSFDISFSNVGSTVLPFDIQ